MLFRYDIGEKLDLSNFNKQAEHYIRTEPDNLFEFYMHDFIIEMKISYHDMKCIKSNHGKLESFCVPARLVTINIFDIKRLDSVIIDKKEVRVRSDKRFNIFPEVRDMFYKDAHATSIFILEDTPKLIDSIYTLCTAVHKLGKLKAFL